MMRFRFWQRRGEDLDEELQSHLRMAARERLERGETPEQAEQAARREFGNVDLIKEITSDMWGWRWLVDLRADTRFGLRMLCKSPAFTTVAVLTLALGIGANTAIFSLIDAVMLRSLPVRDQQHLLVFSWKAKHELTGHRAISFGDCTGNNRTSGCWFSVPFFQRIHSTPGVFSTLAAFAGPLQLDISGNGSASIADASFVSGDYFATLGINTELGRVLQPADDCPSAPAALVLSYGYWQSAFGGDRSVVGRTVRLNDVPFTIVGVADQQFTYLSPGKTQDFWLPIAKLSALRFPWIVGDVLKDSSQWFVVILARLKPKVSVSEAHAAATLIFRNELLHGAKLLAKDGDDPMIALTAAPQALIGTRRRYATLLYVVIAAVGLVLLIACANVAGLTLGRSGARNKEIAVRLALGAARGRVARQLLTESLMLSVLGGALGVLLAYWGVRGTTALVSSDPDRPFRFIVAPDWRVLLFALSACLISGIVFGVAPAMRGFRVNLTSALKENAPPFPSNITGRRLHLGGSLVLAQVALSIVVLIGAALLARTLQNLRNLNLGFDATNILLFGIDAEFSGYKGGQVQNLYRDLRDRLGAIPGVESVSYSSDALLSGGLSAQDIHLRGQPEKSSVETDVLAVGPGFLSTMSIPLLAGRSFTPADFASAAAANAVQEARDAGKRTASPAVPPNQAAPFGAPIPVIVNDAFALKFFGGVNPLGRYFDDAAEDVTVTGAATQSPGYQIIGIARDARYSDLRREIQPTMYIPQIVGEAHFELRTASEPLALVPVVRDIVGKIDAELPLFDIRTQSEQIDLLLLQERLIARLSSFFGVLALALACIGLYGLLSYEVTRRTQEIGIRMALGAQGTDVLRLVVGQGLAPALLGLGIGIIGALAFTRLLSSLLFGINPTDPLTFIVVSLILAGVAAVGSYVPARRAMCVDPMVALRHE